MKSLITLSILAATLHFAPTTFGEDPAAAGKGGKHHGDRFGNLTPNEREKLKNAHQKAMQDPAVQSAYEKMKLARKEFHDAAHAAMLKADPSIQPVLDKMPKGKKDDD